MQWIYIIAWFNNSNFSVVSLLILFFKKLIYGQSQENSTLGQHCQVLLCMSSLNKHPLVCISPDSPKSGPWNIVLTRQSESHVVIWQRTRPGYCGVITQSIWSDMTALVNRWPDTKNRPMGPSRRTGTKWKGLEPDIAVHVRRVAMSTGSGLECGVTEWDQVTEGWGICR